MEKEQCIFCKDTIDAFNENEFYRINSKVYCSLGCFYDNQNKVKEKRPTLKAKKRTQTNKINKSKNRVHKKKPKQKKSKK